MNRRSEPPVVRSAIWRKGSLDAPCVLARGRSVVCAAGCASGSSGITGLDRGLLVLTDPAQGRSRHVSDVDEQQRRGEEPQQYGGWESWALGHRDPRTG